MAVSGNGWRVLEERPDTPTVIDGTGGKVRLYIRPGDVAVVLGWLAAQFHARVESLTLHVSETPGYDDWGWAYRPVTGQTSGYSNHASATAIDLNATRHPRGVKGTFSVEQTKTIRSILAVLDGVVRWGRDYVNSPIDDMHFEIDASAARVADVADKLRELEADMPLTAADLAAIRKVVREEIASGAGEAVWSTKFVRYTPDPESGEREPETCSHILFSLDANVQAVQQAVEEPEPEEPIVKTQTATPDTI